MNHRRIILLITALAILFQINLLYAEETHLYKIDLSINSNTTALVDAGIFPLSAIPNDHALAELTEQQMTRVIRMGYAVDYLAESLQDFRTSDETDEFQTYSSMTAQLQTWSLENADIAILYDLATTPDNHQVWAMKVSDNPLLEEDEPVCYFVGCHHGDEKISAEVPMYFLGYIFDNYGINPDVTYWVDNREIWVIPMHNPDGFEITSRNNANNVDLNRNYSFHWGESAWYYGPYPFSEVETQAVRDLNLQHHFTTSQSYHCAGELILYPFAWDANHPTPDDAIYQEITTAMSLTAGYVPLQSGNLYPHGGEHNDYLYAEQGVIAVTTELEGLWGSPPDREIERVCLDNLPNDLYLLERAGGAQITGVVTDASTGDPLVAECEILEVWDPVEIYPRYSEPEFGRYRHLLVPGTYTLEVLKSGYISQTIDNITVVAGQPTVIDVQLQFVGYPAVVITMEPVNPPIYIPATGGTFEFEMNLANVSGIAQTADVWIDVTLPGGSSYGPLALREDINMPSGYNVFRTLSQYVPLPAPEGQYTMNAYVGNYGISEIWDEAHFNFMKVCCDGESISCFPQVSGFDLDETKSENTPASYNFFINAFPNPFNPTTAISYQLSAFIYVNLTVYDIQGREVAKLVNGWQNAGRHEVTFNASNLSSGIYIYCLITDGYSASSKMVLMK